MLCDSLTEEGVADKPHMPATVLLAPSALTDDKAGAWSSYGALL